MSAKPFNIYLFICLFIVLGCFFFFFEVITLLCSPGWHLNSLQSFCLRLLDPDSRHVPQTWLSAEPVWSVVLQCFLCTPSSPHLAISEPVTRLALLMSLAASSRSLKVCVLRGALGFSIVCSLPGWKVKVKLPILPSALPVPSSFLITPSYFG